MGDLVSNIANRLRAAGGARLVSFLAPGTGAMARPVEDKMREVISVADYGADNSGVANSSVAFQRAYDAAGAGDTIRVPAGLYNVVTPPAGSKKVMWDCRGAYAPNGASPLTLPGVQIFANGNHYPEYRAQMGTATDYSNLASYRDANYVGGTPGVVNSAIKGVIDVRAGTTAFEWGVLGVVNVYSADGESVGCYGQGNKHAAGPAWGGVAEAIDHTGLADPTRGLIGMEVDVRANNTDANKNRVGIDVVAARRTTGPGDFGHVSYGVRVQNNADANMLVKQAFAVTAANVTTGFDTSEATIIESAYKMAAGQGIAFDAPATHQLTYDGTGLLYKVGGAFKVRMNADGSMTMNGGVTTIVGSFSTGTRTPTLGSNKPGANGGNVAVWLSVIINGGQFWVPAWAD